MERLRASPRCRTRTHHDPREAVEVEVTLLLKVEGSEHLLNRLRIGLAVQHSGAERHQRTHPCYSRGLS